MFNKFIHFYIISCSSKIEIMLKKKKKRFKYIRNVIYDKNEKEEI